MRPHLACACIGLTHPRTPCAMRQGQWAVPEERRPPGRWWCHSCQTKREFCCRAVCFYWKKETSSQGEHSSGGQTSQVLIPTQGKLAQAILVPRASMSSWGNEGSNGTHRPRSLLQRLCKLAGVSSSIQGIRSSREGGSQQPQISSRWQEYTYHPVTYLFIHKPFSITRKGFQEDTDKH